jgi:glycosyltransferase involved in cell wall biosynthesis
LARADVVIALTYYAPYVSGLTNVARDVAEGLAGRGHRVTVVCTRHRPDLPGTEELAGVRVVRAPVAASIGKGVVSPRFVPLVLREARRARVLNLHLPLLEAGAVAAVAAAPLLVTYHCDVCLPSGPLNRLQQRAVDAASRAAVRRARAVVVSSEDYARHSRLWPQLRGRQVVVPPPCRDRSGGVPTFRDGGGLHVGFLGRVVAEKGLEHLVAGFRLLEDPASRLLIGGDFIEVAGGSVVDRVRRRIENDPRIRVLGFVPEQDLADFYASLDVFALPSVNALEAFGIAQVEAMIAGVPALASDLPGVREPVLRTGFGALVPPADAGAVATALARLRDTPPDPRAGATAARSLFDVGRVLGAYEELLARF